MFESVFLIFLTNERGKVYRRTFSLTYIHSRLHEIETFFILLFVLQKIKKTSKKLKQFKINKCSGNVKLDVILPSSVQYVCQSVMPKI